MLLISIEYVSCAKTNKQTCHPTHAYIHVIMSNLAVMLCDAMRCDAGTVQYSVTLSMHVAWLHLQNSPLRQDTPQTPRTPMTCSTAASSPDLKVPGVSAVIFTRARPQLG